MPVSTAVDPDLSIIIPCYNQGEFVLEAIASVERLSGVRYELVIVNDGSSDRHSQRVLAELSRSGYHVIDQENQGLSAARNRGISATSGRYLLPLDADNKLQPWAVPKAVSILDQRPEVGIVFGYPELFGTMTGLLEVPQFDLAQFLLGNSIDACALYRREIWQQVGGYDSQIPQRLGYEDWDFWLGAAEQGWAFHHLAEVTFYYRCRERSMVSGCNQPANRRDLFRYICTKHFQLYHAHFPEVFAAKEAERLQLEIDRDRLRQDVTTLHTALQAERDRFHHLHDLWEARESQRLSHMADREAFHQQIAQSHADRDRLSETVAILEAQVNQVMIDRDQLAAQLAAIETSKFWRLRRRWLRLRRVFWGSSQPELVD